MLQEFAVWLIGPVLGAAILGVSVICWLIFFAFRMDERFAERQRARYR